MDALVALAKDIKTRHDIPPERVLGHSDVAPLRKQDPGELFDWYRLFVEGIANWPTPKAVHWSDEQFFQALAAYGYDLTGPAKANIDPQRPARAACVAFCRHFRPAVLRPTPDPEMKTILAGLVDKRRRAVLANARARRPDGRCRCGLPRRWRKVRAPRKDGAG